MAGQKTTANDRSVDKFLNGISDHKKRQDCLTLLTLMKQATKAEPRMWGSSIVGFGSYHYKYDSGREGDWFLSGFSPRKQNLTVYIISGFSRYEQLLKKLGRYKTAKSCLYIRSLKDIDLSILKHLVKQSVEDLRKAHE